jgi:hypothetical protein
MASQCQLYLGQLYLGQLYLGQLYLGQLYLGQLYLGQLYLGQLYLGGSNLGRAGPPGGRRGPWWWGAKGQGDAVKASRPPLGAQATSRSSNPGVRSMTTV